MFLLVCFLGTSFIPCYADNNLVNKTNNEETTISESISLLAPRKKYKPKKRSSSRRGSSDLAFENGKFAIDLGAGIPVSSSGYKTNIPPIFISGEYCVWSGTNMALGIGAYGGYESSTYDPYASLAGFYEGATTTPDIRYLYSYLILGGKISLHYNFSSNFEIYASLIVAYNSVSTKLEGKDANIEGVSPLFTNLAVSGVLPSSALGIKYYFTDNIGIFLEGGYGITVIDGGLSLKF